MEGGWGIALSPCGREGIGERRRQRFSAVLRRFFSVFIGASTTKLLASQDGMLPPGSVCTW
ncbi:hypothetical protein FQZ97_1059370 [compost metagenome]